MPTMLEIAKTLLAEVSAKRAARKQALDAGKATVQSLQAAIDQMAAESHRLAEAREALKTSRLAALAALDERAVAAIDEAATALSVSHEVGVKMRDQIRDLLASVGRDARLAVAREIVRRERGAIDRAEAALADADSDVMLAHMGRFRDYLATAMAALDSIEAIRNARQELVDAGFSADVILDFECELPPLIERVRLAMAATGAGIHETLMRPLPNARPREKPILASGATARAR